MSRGPGIAALVGPLLAVAGVALGLYLWDPAWSREVEHRNNTHGPEQIRAALAGKAPRFIAIGNSVTAADIQEESLASGLRAGGAVKVLTSPGSLAPTWYLVLKNEVFGAGLQPETVVLANPLSNFVEVRPSSELEFERMTEFMDGEEPALRAVMGSTGPWEDLTWWFRLRRARLRTAVLDGVRDDAVALVWGPDTRAGGESRVERAFERVFAAPADPRLVFRGVAVTPDRSPSPVAPEESFLPLFAALAAENGAKLVVVDTPHLDASGDLPEEERAALLAWLRAHDVQFVDLSQGFEADDFVDAWHLLDAPALRFTRRLGAALRGGTAKEAAVARSGKPWPLAPEVWESVGPCAWRGALRGIGHWRLPPPATREALVVEAGGGALAASEVPLSGCAGAWWMADGQIVVSPAAPPTGAFAARVRLADLDDAAATGSMATLLAPGQSLTWTLAPGVATDGVTVRVQGRTLSEGNGQADMWVGGERVHMAWTEKRTAFRVIHAFPPTDGPLVFSVRSTPNAPWMWFAEVELTPATP